MGGHNRQRTTSTPGYWIVVLTLVGGCAAADTVVSPQNCTTIVDNNSTDDQMPLQMPEDLLDLGSGDGVYCNDGDGSQVRWLYSPVTNGDDRTYWIVANPDLVDAPDVEQFFTGLADAELSVELVDTSETADYYLASTDLGAARAAVESSSDTLSIANYQALRMLR